MKKFFAILAIASVMVACNNGAEGEKKEGTADSVPPVTEPKTDSPAVKVDSPAVKVDSPAVKVDSPATKK